MLIVTCLFIAAIGLIVGSFSYVVVLRLHAGKQFAKGRSECEYCHHTLSPLDLVPLLSWVALRGKCRYCRHKLSWQYPLVELTTSVLFVTAFLTHQPTTYGEIITLLIWSYVIASLVILSVYDIRWYLLPDKVLLPLIAPALALAIVGAFGANDWHVLVGPLLAGLLFGGGFYLLAWVSKGAWMGGGDIKLAFVMGLLLGLQKTALAMFVGFVSAAIIGLILVMIKRKGRRDQIPFGPFLIAGTLVAYFWGDPIIAWYLHGLDPTVL